MKHIRSQEEGLSCAGILRSRGRGSSDAGRPHFWCKKP